MFPGLDERQQQAVDHDTGHLMVVAGAGSGKTRTLAARVGRLLDRGVPARSMLLLTFSRRAAREMLARLGPRARDVWGGTFHAVGHRLLRRHALEVGLSPTFTVLDEADRAQMMGLIRADHLPPAGGRRFPSAEVLADIYSRVVNEERPVVEVVRRFYPWCGEEMEAMKAVFGAYLERKRANLVVDFDDLLVYWRALPEQPRFHHVLVDEYQDLNALQAEIVVGLAKAGATVTGVGDDAQAIYSFRAGSPRHMLGFGESLPGAASVVLGLTYRGTPEVVAAANAVMPGKSLRSVRAAGPRPQLVTCADEMAQARYVCDTVLSLRDQGLRLQDQAVLCRAAQHSDGLELELGRRRIPYVKYGGLRYLEAAHVKDLVALLRVLDNPADELAWHRVLLLLEGVGPATARKLFAAGEVPDTDGLRAALDECHGSPGPPPVVQVDRLRLFLDPIFERRYDAAPARSADLDQLAARAVECSTRSELLAELVLDPPTRTSDQAGPPHLDDDWLVLSTIHSAKGGEWKAVFLIHASDGNIPLDMALHETDGLDEERRLLYVALTRAKDHLHVTVPHRYYHRRRGRDDASTWGQPSRFLRGPEIEAAFDHHQVAAPDPVMPRMAELFG